MHEDSLATEGDPKPELIPLDVPVPPRLTEAFGYRGSARFVGFHWHPGGDDLVFDDGRCVGTGDGWGFLAYLRHRAAAAHLEPFNFGFSDDDATDVLVIDRANDLAGVLPVAAAHRFLQQQHPPPPDLSPEQLEHARRIIENSLIKGWQERQIDPAIIRRAIEERRQVIESVVSYLDRWPHV